MQTVHLSKHGLSVPCNGDEDFLRHARAIAQTPCSVVLLSGGPLWDGDENRYSLAAWDPFLLYRAKSGRCELTSSRGTVSFDANPLEILDEVVGTLRPEFPLVAPPFSGGALGYLSYDLKNCIERLPQTALDDLDLPDLFLLWPQRILVHDRRENRFTHLEMTPEGEAPSPPSFLSAIPGSSFPGALGAGTLRSNFTRPEYLDAVRAVREYILSGDVYQVNLSQRFRFPFRGDPFRLWTALFQKNPAPFYAFVNGGDHWVLSTSMERFLCRRGGVLETRPIKGTRKRGRDDAEDTALKLDLLDDPKDDAELSMIVDLLRNDLGRICAGRSVRVKEHKRLETYQNVHHLVSVVEGELRPGVSLGDILRATFPGGSVTGCPKIRSMEIIDELEPTVRHVYTGAIGYFGWHDNMDSNIAIRTALVHNEQCYFSVGGGVVYDSREEDEYEETLHKARTFFEVIREMGVEIR
ncbi:MAG TPA: aminodeoxychorismate synthase component I [Syntrophobacteraceae bacterium]|nr:aminodeoxychorismate synthase component I [Syntrophobacteraceae bacterium]